MEIQLKEVKDWNLGKKLGQGLCGVVVHGTMKGNEEKKVCFFVFFVFFGLVWFG